MADELSPVRRPVRRPPAHLTSLRHADRARRPAAVTASGVLHLAGMLALCLLAYLIRLPLPEVALAALIAAMGHLVVGLGLLRMAPWAPGTAIALSLVLALAMLFPALSLSLFALRDLFQGRTSPEQAVVVTAFAYIVLQLLALHRLNRPEVREAFEWKRRLEP